MSPEAISSLVLPTDVFMVLQGTSGHGARVAAIITPALPTPRTVGARAARPRRHACDTMRAWRGDAISQTAIVWAGCGLVMATSWGVVSVINTVSYTHLRAHETR